MLSLLQNRLSTNKPSELPKSKLYNEANFYKQFISDLKSCRREVIIESPFATCKRISMLLPTLEQLKAAGVRVIVNTKDPEDLEGYMQLESRKALSMLMHIGVQIIYTKNHHRKIAVLDRNITWEGSLNILSQNNSCEIMRRTESTPHAWQLVRFTGIDKLMS